MGTLRKRIVLIAVHFGPAFAQIRLPHGLSLIHERNDIRKGLSDEHFAFRMNSEDELATETTDKAADMSCGRLLQPPQSQPVGGDLGCESSHVLRFSATVVPMSARRNSLFCNSLWTATALSLPKSRCRPGQQSGWRQTHPGVWGVSVAVGDLRYAAAGSSGEGVRGAQLVVRQALRPKRHVRFAIAAIRGSYRRRSSSAASSTCREDAPASSSCCSTDWPFSTTDTTVGSSSRMTTLQTIR